MTNEEAIAFLNTDDYESKGYNDAVGMAIKALENSRWIPVTERLPEERDWYLATFREKDSKYQWLPRVADYLPQKNEWRFIDGDREVVEGCMLECVAWMPLPKPYKEGAE